MVPCLERKKIQQTVVTCDDDHVLYGGSCYTPNSMCQIKYGQFSKSISFVNRQNMCDCVSGYVWNPGQTACVEKQKTNDQVCKDSYGINSYYTNKIDKDGKIICDCMKSFKWNEEGTSCVQVAKKMSETSVIKSNIVSLSPDEVCAKDHGEYYRYAGYQNDQGAYVCDCVEGYILNESGDQCVKKIVPTQKIKKKVALEKIVSIDKMVSSTAVASSSALITQVSSTGILENIQEGNSNVSRPNIFLRIKNLFNYIFGR